MRRINNLYSRRTASLTDAERRKLRSYGASIDAIAKRIGMESRTIEELVSIGGRAMPETIERVRQRMQEVDNDDARTNGG